MAPRFVADEGMRGASLAELLIALTLALIVAAGLGQLASDARAVFIAQPEASDLLQRGRIAVDWMVQDVAAAGAGPWRVDEAGPLVRRAPPIHPRRLGAIGADPEWGAFADRVTVLSVPDRAPQSALADMGRADAPLLLRAGPWCPPNDPSCGFDEGDRLLVFDATGAFDTLVAAEVGPGLVTPRLTPLSKAYRLREQATVVGVRMITYYVDEVRRQLRRYDGDRSDVPIVDDVVGLRIRYFGDPLPPDEPRPPPGDENCVVDRAGLPRLPVLAPDHGALVELTPAMLSDGPWCGAAPRRFDADLYRVRRLRVTLRLQAESPAVRGTDSVRFARAGTARDARVETPDLELAVDVSPPNLQWP